MKYYLFALLDKAPTDLPSHLYCEVKMKLIDNIPLLYSEVEDKAPWLKNQNPKTHPAVLHNQVLEELLKTCTVLPFAFPTFLHHHHKLEELFLPHYNIIKESVKDLSGKVEFSLKLQIPNEGKAKVSSEFVKGGSPAQKYIQERYQNYQKNNQHLLQAQTYYEQLVEILKPVIQNHKVKYLPKSNISLQAHFLIDKSQVASFKDIFQQEVVQNPNYQFLLSGAWACYNFTNLKIKL